MIPTSVANYLEQSRARYSVVPHPPAYTAQEEAAAAHVPGGQWAKAVVCFADDQPILAVLPAPCMVELDRLQHAAHARSIRLAKEAEFARLYQECETGAMPPLGPLYGQRVFVDTGLAADTEIAFNGGSHRDAIRMPYREFERLAHPTVAAFASAASASPAPRMTMAIDPVCGATVEEDTAAARSEHAGNMYYFCSHSCKMEFDDNPYAYSRDRAPSAGESTAGSVNREEQMAEAARAAEQVDIPGEHGPESPFEVLERIAREEPQVRKPERG